MPTLDEVLAAVPAGKEVLYRAEIGAGGCRADGQGDCASSVSPEQIVLISFHADAIAECKKQMPHIKALWLCRLQEEEGWHSRRRPVEEVAATLKRIHADGLDAEAVPEYVDEAFIKRLHELGCREFSVWTVDDPKVAQFYARPWRVVDHHQSTWLAAQTIGALTRPKLWPNGSRLTSFGE